MEMGNTAQGALLVLYISTKCSQYRLSLLSLQGNLYMVSQK